ncbi:HAD family hydrolase [Marinomonas sp. S3726]|uniref:HAD family hydrolase n=1 Tax=Marinomonas sp. S3726 TaxID=579484 RepID=UPI0005F9CCBD|nr:HAD hydrolase-like protein [Marinomonas sp. S3726]KJZ15942.1 HAD family hydrolase [Marinomonas sp. S3726]
MKSIKEYQVIIFDCDGVILNSNKVKTDAFYLSTLPYGEEAASSMVKYHVANGGISRYEKFQYFLNNIVNDSFGGPDLDELLDTYAKNVKEGLLNCELTQGLREFRHSSDSLWFIASGGDQSELREVFLNRGIDSWFDGGIFGSPQNKHEILEHIFSFESASSAILIGDSKYDFEAAISANIDFLFVSDWSEVDSWEKWVDENKITAIEKVGSLLS